MNKPILAAAILSGLTIGLHVIGGGKTIHTPIQGADLSPVLKAVSAVLWHQITALLILQTAAFGWLVWHHNPPLAWFLIAVQISIAGLFLFYGATMLGTVWILGQWTIFLALAGLLMWGLRQKTTGA